MSSLVSSGVLPDYAAPAQKTGGARILAFGVHPYISGAAHRIKYFDAMLAYMKKHKDVVFWQGDQIYDWYTRAVGDAREYGRGRQR